MSEGASATMRDPLADRPAVLDLLRAPDGSRRHAVIEASAGTGKTHTLEHLVVDLLLEGTPIERILVVTFTEKATLEMRARIRARIAALVAAGHVSLRAALVDFDRAPISTIHAFCQRVLAEHAFASGRLLEQQRLDAREAFGRALKDAIRSGLASGARERALLEGALGTMGAAALEELAWRWSRERGEIRPAFDEPALRAALQAMPIEGEVDGPIGRAILASVEHVATRSRSRDVLAGLAPLARRARDGEAIGALFPELFAWATGAPHGRAEPNAPYVATALDAHPTLGAHARALAQHLGSPLPAIVHRLLPAIVARLDEDKRRRGRFDFDDMLRLVHEALSGEGGDVLARALRDRYRYALVDEFQDTDPVQWAIFRRIFFESDAGHALYVIGDPKQSIYAFRSADVHTYLDACAEIERTGGARVPLVDCYRSTPPMIESLNRVLERGLFTGPNRYDHPVRAGRAELRAVGRDGRDVAPIVALHLAARDRIRAKPMRFALAAAIAEEIERLVDGGLRVVDRDDPEHGLRALRPADVFVLTRTAKEAVEVADALRRRGIHHAISTQTGIYETREARDVLDVLRAIEDPGARGARLRAFLTPFFGIASADLAACRELPADHPFTARLARWSALAREHRFAPLFQAMLDESGLARRLLFLREGERELTNYQHVLELLLARAGKGRLALPEIVGELASLVDDGSRAGEDEEVQRLESERGAVQLLTMHKSKGLEAEVVFLFGGTSKRPAAPTEPRIVHEGSTRIAWLGAMSPDLEARAAAEEREEHERLLYVAMTRARSRLYLPYVGPAPSGSPLPAGQVSEFPRLSGAYRALNDRLVQLAAEGVIGDAIEHRVITVTGARRRIALPPPLPEVREGASEVEGASTLAIPEVSPRRFEILHRASRGIEVTSYTRMKAGRVRVLADEPSAWIEEQAREPIVPSMAIEDPLPGGTAFGVFVHEILEHVDFAVVQGAEDGAALLADPSVRALFERGAERNGIDPVVIGPSADLVHRTLRTPIRAGALSLPEGLASIPRDRRVAEMSFLHPIPERAHPAFGAWHGPDRAPLEIDRGLVRGVIDLVFVHEGRTWILDWKTDRLPAYEPAAISAHVEAHYEIQARLYALGGARLLRIAGEVDHDARFGGIVYCFLRGMRSRARGPTDGVHVARPDLPTLRGWDRAMREDDAPWGHPLPARRAAIDLSMPEEDA